MALVVVKNLSSNAANTKDRHDRETELKLSLPCRTLQIQRSTAVTRAAVTCCFFYLQLT